MTQAALASSTCGHSGQHLPGGGGSARAPHVSTGHVCRVHTAVPFRHVQSVHGSTRNGLRCAWYSFPIIQGFNSVVPETDNENNVRWCLKHYSKKLLGLLCYIWIAFSSLTGCRIHMGHTCIQSILKPVTGASIEVI